MPLTILCAVFNAYDLMILFYLLFNGAALVLTTAYLIYKGDRYDREHSN